MSAAAKYVDAFLDGMDKSGTALYNRVIPLVRSMEEGPTGLTSGAFNTLKVEAIAGVFEDFFNSPAYEARVQGLLDAMLTIGVEVSQRYSSKASPQAIQQAAQMYDRYLYALSGVLDDEQAMLAVMSPYINDAFAMIGSGRQKGELEHRTTDLREALHAYFVTKVTTTVEQYERELYAIYAEDLGSTRFLYMGPEDERNRDFCAQRVDKVYTAEQIQSWADEDWDGKIPGTNAENIWVNCGGFSCRHILIPA
jgi:hypothetical protein